MAIVGAQLVTKVAVEGDAEAANKVRGYGQVVDQTQGKSDKASGAIGGMFKQALSFAAGQAIFAGLGILKDQIAGIFSESMNAQEGLAQTNQVIASTKGVAGVTANAVLDLATQYSHLTKFSDDTVQASENMLLTFTNIGKNVFPMATKTVLDMSQALGQDTKSSAIQLGKALNDPIQGVSALQRVGVTFTQTQKDQIKHFMDTNNIAGAQGIILQELQKEFGGSAEAAGKTFGGQLAIAQQRLDDVKQAIGDKLMPILANFLGFVQGTVAPAIGAAFTNMFNALKPFGYFLQYVGYIGGKALKDIGDTLTQVGQIFKSVFGGIGGGDNPLVMFFSNILTVAYPMVQQLGQVFHDFMMNLQKNLSTINPQQIIGFFQSIGTAFNDFKGYALPILQQVAGIVGGQLKQDFQTFMGIVQNLAGWWQSTMVPAIKAAMPGFLALGNVLFTQVVPALARLWAAGHQIVDALMPVFIKVFETVEPIIVRVGGFISGLLAKALQFLIPYIMQAAQEVVKFAKEIAERAMPVITQIGTLISTVLGFIMAHWTQIWGVLGPIVLGVFNIIKGIIQTAWAIISGIFKVALDLLSGNWGRAWTDIKDMFSGIWAGIQSILRGAWGVISGMVGGLISNIIGFFASLPGKAISAVGGLLGKLKDFFGGLAGQALTWGWNIISNLASGIINGIWSALGNAMNAVGTFIHDHLPFSPAKRGPLRDLALQGSKISEQIGQGMVAGIPKLQTSLNMLLTPMVSMTPRIAPNSGPTIIVQPPAIYLDGQRLTQAQMPYLANAIRYATGARGF